VIVYRVQTTDPLGHAQNSTAPVELLTTAALTPGQAFTSDTQVKVRVIDALPGGFSISVDNPVAIVPDVVEMSAAIAANVVHAAGLVAKFTGSNTTHSWVFSQSPKAGHEVALGSTVTMVLHSGPLP
jgi:hypothetical protein